MKGDLPQLKTALLNIGAFKEWKRAATDQTAIRGLQVHSRFKQFASARALTRASSLSAASGNEVNLAITENEPTREAF